MSADRRTRLALHATLWRQIFGWKRIWKVIIYIFALCCLGVWLSSRSKQPRVPTAPKAFQALSALDGMDQSLIKADLCLIIPWSRPDFPKYGEAFLDSVSRLSPQVQAVLIHDGITNPPPSTIFPNVKVIPLTALDDSFAFRKWPGYLAERLCDIYKTKDRKECEMLENAFAAFDAKLGKTGLSSVQVLKGLYGRVFEDYISPQSCRAWAWTEVDQLYGNILSAFDPGSFLWDSEVVTIVRRPVELLLTEEFTAFIQSRNADLVNHLWRACRLFSSIGNLRQALKSGVFSSPSVATGCISQAVFNSAAKISILTSQASPIAFDFGQLDMQGILWAVSSCLKTQIVESDDPRDNPLYGDVWFADRDGKPLRNADGTTQKRPWYPAQSKLKKRYIRDECRQVVSLAQEQSRLQRRALIWRHGELWEKHKLEASRPPNAVECQDSIPREFRHCVEMKGLPAVGDDQYLVVVRERSSEGSRLEAMSIFNAASESTDSGAHGKSTAVEVLLFSFSEWNGGLYFLEHDRSILVERNKLEIGERLLKWKGLG